MQTRSLTITVNLFTVFSAPNHNETCRRAHTTRPPNARQPTDPPRQHFADNYIPGARRINTQPCCVGRPHAAAAINNTRPTGHYDSYCPNESSKHKQQCPCRHGTEREQARGLHHRPALASRASNQDRKVAQACTCAWMGFGRSRTGLG